MVSHMVIGDAHAKHGVSNDRFTWAGKMALDYRPDVIIDIGDWADMESLCSYDKGKKSFEGRRYKKDVRAAVDARKRFLAPIQEYNERQKANKKAQYKPRMVSTTGNHENRINRVCEHTPEMHGTISLKDLKAEQYGWEVVPFLEEIVIDGILYCHYLVSGAMGRPIGGVNHGRSLLQKKYISCTVGHSHYRSFAEATRGDGKKILGLSAGCFFSHNEDYAGQSNDDWWRGIVIKNDVAGGEYNPEFVGIEEIERRYG